MPTNNAPLPWQHETAFYNQHAEAIFSRFPFYHTAFIGNSPEEFVDHILRQARIHPLASVLDMGCGSGYLVDQLATICDVAGISTSRAAIRQCKINYPERSFYEGNMETFLRPGLTHCIALESIGYADISKTFHTAYQNLKSGGLFYIKHWFIKHRENYEDQQNRIAFEHYWKYIPHHLEEFLGHAMDVGFSLKQFKDVTELINQELFDASLPYHKVEFELPYPEAGPFLFAGEMLMIKS